ncbi:hypothetical protein CTAYLR_005442 [Chrysophaeum taylorii]|uniref:Exostosin GT47 domain-containing protein n=1 Tax=Chrysophaeum taylorii TaxID=2483200 RepID=A0AAD7XPT2_9STRA|nr:hypothetical protein CTAYLR_005442 [Chrysophaeum taylorii]
MVVFLLIGLLVADGKTRNDRSPRALSARVVSLESNITHESENEEAGHHHHHHHHQHHHSCEGRRVFVYNLSSWSSSLWDVQEEDLTFDAAFGEAEGLGGHLRLTRQWSASQILYYRVSRSACRTRDPKGADVFVAPLWPKAKGFQRMLAACNVSESTLLEALPYLAPETACRHLVLVAKSFRSCSSGRWFYDPVDPVFNKVAKFAYDEPLPWHPLLFPNARQEPHLASYVRSPEGLVERCSYLGGNASANCGNPPGRFPNIHSVPYPSSVHWSPGEPDPTTTTSSPRRPILMLFVGHFDKGGLVRAGIRTMCREYDDPLVCTTSHATRDLAIKGQSVFCLEPPGDSPSRKSISDSLAFGCVPVVFENATAAQYSLFWTEDARVTIDYASFVSGAVDLRDHLESYSADRVRAMQQAVARCKKAFTYSFDDDVGDAIDIMLGAVARQTCANNYHSGVLR